MKELWHKIIDTDYSEEGGDMSMSALIRQQQEEHQASNEFDTQHFKDINLMLLSSALVQHFLQERQMNVVKRRFVFEKEAKDEGAASAQQSSTRVEQAMRSRDLTELLFLQELAKESEVFTDLSIFPYNIEYLEKRDGKVMAHCFGERESGHNSEQVLAARERHIKERLEKSQNSSQVALQMHTGEFAEYVKKIAEKK